MLRDLDLSKYPKVYIACGYTDLRLGIKGLSEIVKYRFGLDYYDSESIYLFCGKKAATIKAITFEKDGPLMLTKRLVNGRYQWPRTPEEARMLTPNQFKMLMAGFSIESRIPGGEREII